ncbi:hypothetical protein BGZ50_007601 [Haplosporangium sp. Z 11]|nr:hypothetical protein BGZ50_007601 [Haplosporangium sp. Z 11]
MAASQFRITNRAGVGWMKNFPGTPDHPLFTLVIADNQFASVYERWSVERFEEGYMIRNVGTRYWLTARGEEAVGSSQFDAENAKWYIESAGDGSFTIKLPNQDLVLSGRQREPGSSVAVSVEPADGSETQLWSIQPME